MRFDELVVLRGGGDLATGVAYRLHHAGFPVVVCELARPLTVRRTVALSSAVTAGEVTVEGIVGRRASAADARSIAISGVIPVLVSEGRPALDAAVVVDARMAKRNIDTTILDAPLVVGLGPGFTAGVDCHAVVETMRGHHLGRVVWSGCAEPNTGSPGVVAGHGAERVLRAPTDGVVVWYCAIGAVVRRGELLGRVGTDVVTAPFDGLLRGLVLDGTVAAKGMKIGDVDPRVDLCTLEISDKALAIGGGVVEAVLTSR